MGIYLLMSQKLPTFFCLHCLILSTFMWCIFYSFPFVPLFFFTYIHKLKKKKKHSVCLHHLSPPVVFSSTFPSLCSCSTYFHVFLFSSLPCLGHHKQARIGNGCGTSVSIGSCYEHTHTHRHRLVRGGWKGWGYGGQWYKTCFRDDSNVFF